MRTKKTELVVASFDDMMMMMTGIKKKMTRDDVLSTIDHEGNHEDNEGRRKKRASGCRESRSSGSGVRGPKKAGL